MSMCFLLSSESKAAIQEQFPKIVIAIAANSPLLTLSTEIDALIRGKL